jgi:D-amino-acid dehydrogenase
MTAIVVGAGIIGVCTAHALAERGIDVTVVDSASTIASGASEGNAGVIAPGYVTPWAAPGMPGKVLSYLLRAESPVRLHPRPDPALWGWLLRWLRECDLARYRRNRERMQRLAFYSRDELHRLLERHPIDYHRRRGYLQLFRSERDVDLAEPARRMLVEAGVPHSLVDGAGVRAYYEPDLEPGTPLAAGLWLPDDESGSCPQFARRLAAIAESRGARFRLGTAVAALDVAGGSVGGLRLVDGSRIAADTVVVAAGAESCRLLAPVGVRVPLWPVHGHSISAPLREGRGGPRHAMIDEAYKTAITPFGPMLRVAGTALIGPRAGVASPGSWRTLERVAHDWFGDIADWSRAERWTGARPMLPDGPPVLGRTAIHGLYLNLGHGSTGWAMACGSGAVVADLASGRPPAIDLDGLTIERYA